LGNQEFLNPLLLKLVKFASSLDSGTVGQWVKGKRVKEIRRLEV